MSPDSMATGWFYAKRGAPLGPSGPLSWQELYDLAQGAELRAGDLVWHPQLPDWTPAAGIPGLFAATPAATPGAAAVPGMTPPATERRPQTRRRHLPLAAWLAPLILVVLVGAGLGTYFGAFYHRNETPGQTGPGTTAAVTSTTKGQTVSSSTTSTTVAVEMGATQAKAPDAAKLVTSAKWGEVPANTLIVTLADGGSRADAQSVAQTLGGTVVGEIEFINAYLIETAGATEADLQATLDKAAALPRVVSAFPNLGIKDSAEFWGIRVSPLSDPVYGSGRGAGFELIGVQRAWDYIRGSGLHLWDAHVGVVDSGIYKGMGEFDGEVSLEFPDSSAGEIKTPDQVQNPRTRVTVNDPTGSHGTMVAGIVGADSDNGGMTGIASVLGPRLTVSSIDYEAGVYGTDVPVTGPDPDDPTVVTLRSGKSFVFGSLVAITKQIEAGARVINCSWGAEKLDPNNAGAAAAYRKFFQKMATEHPDVTFVCAAGNEAGALTPTNDWPAGAGSGLSNVIIVGNVLNDATKAPSSNVVGVDGEITLAAPGEEVVQGVFANGDPIVNTTDFGNGMAFGGGTSAAAPQVSAAAALLLALDPTLHAADIKEILSRTARPGPPDLGGKILAIDQAVLEVINRQREEQGLPAVTGAELEKNGAIDAVATTTDQPDVFSVRGILTGEPAGGATQVIISGSYGVGVDGDESQSVIGAGEAMWPVVNVTVEDRTHPATITVTRQDNGAASIITIETPDLNGQWEGIFTITELTAPKSTDTTEEGEGCSELEIFGAIMEHLLGQPIPMIMDVTADMEAGTGTAVLLIDFVSFISQLPEVVAEGDKVSMTNDPQTFPFTVSGNTITFQLPEGDTSGMTTSVTAIVARQGDSVVMKGKMTSSGQGASFLAVWTVTQLP